MCRSHFLRRRGPQLHRSGAVRSGIAALALALTALPVWAGGTTPGAPVAGREIDAGCKFSGTDIVFDAARGLSIERIQGQAARTHLLNLMARHPEQFAKAHAAIANRGATPTEEVFVLRSLALADPVTESSSTPGLVPRSVAIGDASGEMVFWSWDDGDPNTWEGEIYVAHYAEHYEGIFEGQFAIGAVPYSVAWENLVWQNRDPWSQIPDGAAWGNVATAGRDLGAGIGNVGEQGLLESAGEPPKPKHKVYLTCWLGAASMMCTQAAWQCIGAAWGWPVCFALACPVGGFMAASIGCLFYTW